MRDALPRATRVLPLLALLVLVVGALPAPAAGQASITGQWTTLPGTMPINPIHVGLLRTGKVLVVTGSENDPTMTTYRAAVYTPQTGAFSVKTIPWDLFCNGMSYLPDGRALITGGNLQYNPFRGIRTTTVFDPATEAFIQVQDMARGRWYPSNVALPDGRTATFSGWLEGGGTNRAVELYRVATGWGPEMMAPFTPPLYPWLHLLPAGTVFQSGPSIDSHVLHPGSGTWTTNVARTLYPRERVYGSSVLLPLRPGEGHRARIMIMGGDNPATATAEIIDLSQPSPTWRALPPMSAPRIQMNAVLLPTGTVLALGGSAQNNQASTASLDADLFDPDSETWSPAGRMARPRMYHSVALLLPDATVWVAGSNPQQGTWDDRMELYRPPYLFTSSGALAPRPSIGAAPGVVGYDAAFAVTTPDAGAIASVALVRPGSNTHAFDFEQRLINLSFTASEGTLTIASPPSASIAPPGYYMLFLIDGNGVPSVARFIQLSATPGNQPPSGAITNPAGDVTIRAGQSVTFAGAGTDADGSIGGYSWIFPGGSPRTSTAATPGAVSFSTPGTYHVSLTVTDNLGVNDPSPPVRRITVEPAQLTAAFTSPEAGATVAGTQPVGMQASGASGSANTFTLSIDGAQVFTTTTSGTTASFDWNTTGYPDGEHTLSLTVTDATGATSTVARAVTVDNTSSSGGISVNFLNLSPGQNVAGTISVRISAEGTAGASNRFEISVDGVLRETVMTNATTIDWAWNTAEADNGGRTITVTVRDATGRTGTNNVYVTVANALVVSLTSPSPGATVSGLVWVNVWVDGASGSSNTFTLLVAGSIVASQTSSGRHVTLAWDSTATPNGPHTIRAIVRDAAGNAGGVSRAVTVENAGSTPPPLAAGFSSPAAGATVSGTVSVAMTAGGGTPPYTYRLAVDGAQVFSTTTSSTSAAYSWNTTAYTDAAHTLGLTVSDAASASASASRSVTVANGGGGSPGTLDVGITSPASGATVSGTVWVTVWVTGAAAGSNTYTLTANGTTVWTQTATGNPVSLPWFTTDGPDGQHTLTATVRDSAGNTGARSVSVTVQNP